MTTFEWRPEEEQEKKLKEKKYVTRKEFYICFIILLVVIIRQGLVTRDRVEMEANQVSNAVSMAEDRISGNISSIPRNIEQGIQDANNPIRKSNMEIVDVNIKEKSATIRMTASPKEYQDGMTMKFLVSCDGAEAVEVPAAAGNDRVFKAETEVPFCGVASATVHMKKGGTEYIRSISDVYIETAVLPQFNGGWGGSIGWLANQDYVTFDGDITVDVNTPEWLMNRDKGASFDLKNEKMEVYVDGKMVKTLPVELIHEDEYYRSYFVSVTGENKIQLDDMKEIEFIFMAEDNNGLKYSYLAEKGTWTQKDGYDSDAYWQMADEDKLTIE